MIYFYLSIRVITVIIIAFLVTNAVADMYVFEFMLLGYP